MTVFGLDANYRSTLDRSNKYKFVQNLYLYGSLATENAFDVAAADENLFRQLKSNESAELNVDCVLSNTNIYRAILFWWIDSLDKQHGLVVRRDDMRAIQYARNKFKTKAQNLT